MSGETDFSVMVYQDLRRLLAGDWRRLAARDEAEIESRIQWAYAERKAGGFVAVGSLYGRCRELIRDFLHTANDAKILY